MRNFLLDHEHDPNALRNRSSSYGRDVFDFGSRQIVDADENFGLDAFQRGTLSSNNGLYLQHQPNAS